MEITEKDDSFHGTLELWNHGAPALMKRWNLSQENVASILEIFHSEEVMAMLLSKSGDKSAAQIIYDFHGAPTFINVLRQQYSNNKAVWAEICQRTGYLVTIMKVFSEEDLEEFLTACEGDHWIIVSQLVDSCDALEALSYLQDSLGFNAILDILLCKNNENLPVVTDLSDECKTFLIKLYELEIRYLVSALLSEDQIKEYPSDAIRTWLNETAGDNKPVPNIVKRMQWTNVQVKNKCYPLISQPSILVISIRVGRERSSVEESESLIKAFRTDLSLDVTVEYDLTAEEIFEAITDQQRKIESKSCQIVVIMSHGSLGYINDKNGHRIEIQQLVEKMTPVTHANYPKVLILPCCQSNSGSETAGNDALKEDVDSTNNDDYKRSEIDAEIPGQPGRPRHRSPSPFRLKEKDVCILSSCVFGHHSYRNKFVPKMAAALRNLESHEDLYEAYVVANQALTIQDRTPIFVSPMKLKICLRNVYPSFEEPLPEI